MAEPYYADDAVTLYLGDNRDIVPMLDATVDAIVTDPPYGDTSLIWDRTPDLEWAARLASVAPTLWCFGSMRFHGTQWPLLAAAGWRYGQEVVWEKQNGSGFAADRFKRVHEIAMHWYRGAWEEQHRDTPKIQVFGAQAKVTVTPRAKSRTPHTGAVNPRAYTSDGDRLQRSVLHVRSEHGRAVHPTQKPLGILRPLIAYSVPVGGTVLDPWAGSSSTLLAARDTGRRAIGIEAREDYCEAAAKRLSQMEMVA